MIVRYDILCAGCKAKIRLRISIPIETKQPFLFFCNTCNATYKGIITLKKPPDYEIFVEDCKWVSDGHKEQYQVINIHPELPSLIESEKPEDIGWSPFILQSHLMGNNFLTFMERFNSTKSLIRGDWVKFRRWTQYFMNEDWRHFDKQGQGIMDKKFAFKNIIQRRECHLRVLQVFFFSLLPDDSYLKLNKEFNGILSKMYSKNGEASHRFTKSIVSSQVFKTKEKDLYERLFFVADNFNAIAPAFATLFYNKTTKKLKIRIMRDDFDILRTHFVSTFELCHKMIQYPVGCINLLYRDNTSRFSNSRVTSMSQFNRLPNARKIDYIDEMPILKSVWQNTLNRNLRNALSHQSIRYDLIEGILKDDKGTKIPYIDFVINQFSLLVLILYFIHLTKMMYVNYLIMEK